MHVPIPEFFTNPAIVAFIRITSLTLLLGGPALAAEPDASLWQSCPVDTLAGKPLAPLPHFPPETRDEIHLSAETVSRTSDDESHFNGHVVMEQNNLRLTTEQLIYTRSRQRIQLDTPLQLQTPELALQAQNGWYRLDDKSGEFMDSHYLLPQQHFRGSAASISLDKAELAKLRQVSITSCPEPSRAWELQTDLLKLDYISDTGTAENALLRFQGVPIFYFPWIRFPLGEARRSGFLMPYFGDSNSRGFEFHVPWYWNIAPNQDAIITPGNLARRGPMLSGKYRYLTHNSKGQLEFDYLPNDQVTDQERYLTKLQNQSDFGPGTRLDLLAQQVSDDEYFRDLGSDISIANTTHLESSLTLSHAEELWSASLRAQSYETLDPTISRINYPYRRLPQVTFHAANSWVDDRLEASMEAEWVRFKHQSDARVEADRSDLYPKITIPLVNSWGYIKPAIGAHISHYEFLDQTQAPIDRSLPVTSVDAGLFLERDLLDGTLIQTLEPRLYYLHVPYEDQSGIPLFDTGALDFNFSQLFSDNRFSGIDRIGDTRQLTTAITSRLIRKSSGDELMALSLGQIHYATDRRVSLTNTTRHNSNSDIIAELSGKLYDWSARTTYQWDNENHTSNRKSLQLHYQSDEKHILNLGYRFRNNSETNAENLEQTDVSFALPLGGHFALLGRWNYSITGQQDIERLAALEYDSCCWAMRLMSQHYLRYDGEYDSAITFQLVLKGLGSVAGQKASKTLTNSILGYQPEY